MHTEEHIAQHSDISNADGARAGLDAEKRANPSSPTHRDEINKSVTCIPALQAELDGRRRHLTLTELLKSQPPASASLSKEFRDQFSGGEAQVLIAACMGYDLSKLSLTEVLDLQLKDRDSTLQKLIHRDKVDVDVRKLLKKIDGLDGAMHDYLREVIPKIFRTNILRCVFPEGGTLLPSIHLLGAIGLTRPRNKVYWGYVAVVLADGRGWEIAIHRDPEQLDRPESTVEDYAATMVEMTRLAVDGHRDDIGNLIALCAMQIARLTGYRYLNVREGSDRIDIVELTAETMLGSLSDGSLVDVSFEGVDAPLPNVATGNNAQAS